jgi:hypothetical protein
MNLATLRALVVDLPEVQGWPELREFYEYGLSLPRGDWEWPLLACRAVGGDIERTAPVAAALTCMQLSITLVDDMLDHDPRGLHLRIGEGRTANIAFGLQAAAYHLVHCAALDVPVREAVASCLARMALGTAYGQHLDVQNLEGEGTTGAHCAPRAHRFTAPGWKWARWPAAHPGRRPLRWENSACSTGRSSKSMTI